MSTPSYCGQLILRFLDVAEKNQRYFPKIKDYVQEESTKLYTIQGMKRAICPCMTGQMAKAP